MILRQEAILGKDFGKTGSPGSLNNPFKSLSCSYEKEALPLILHTEDHTFTCKRSILGALWIFIDNTMKNKGGTD